jgi:hypothetical protein
VGVVERAGRLLPQLPTEVIVEVLQHLDARSLSRLACTCRQLYFGPPCPPRLMSLVEAAIRRRADALGRWTPSSLPAGVSKWVPFLLQREWRSEIEQCTVAAGRDRSFFVDANGALLACGAEEQPGLLGLRGGTGQTSSFTAVVPTPVPSLAGVRIRSVISCGGRNLAVSEAGQLFAWGLAESIDDTGWGEWHAFEPTVVLALRWLGRWHAFEPTVVLALRDHHVRQAVAGNYHCAALTEDGALLFTWEVHGVPEPGDEIAELGYGSFVHDSQVPYRVFALAGVRVVSVAAGNRFTVAVTEAGAVYSFGVAMAPWSWEGRYGGGRIPT